jgi:acetolactate synthase-1/2/3 large subunit
VETADQFASALDEALGRGGIRLLHCISDIERLNAAGSTVSGLRAKD